MESPFSLNAAYLTEAEIDYELRIRGIRATRKNLQSKKLILNNQLERSKINIRELKDPDFNAEDEKLIIDATILELDSLISEFSATVEDSFYLVITSRLACLTYRVNRFTVPEQPEESHKLYSEYKEDARASCFELEAKLSSKVVKAENSIKNEIVYPSSSQNKSVPVYKWGVKFNGSTSLNAFLERVTELSKARNVSDIELYNSAIDLFDGPVLVWYRSIRDKISTWNELVRELQTVFLPLEYNETLLDEIKSRKQGRTENICIYVATMQNLFNRLAMPLNDSEQLKIIRRNILPIYIERLALTDINNLNDLIKYCRKIDEATQIKNKYTPPKAINSLESDLAYVDEPGPSKPKNKNHTINNNKSKNFSNNSTPAMPTSLNSQRNKVSAVTCWNCKKSGHVYTDCRRPRSRFCFKCGNPNFTIKTCTTCNVASKN